MKRKIALATGVMLGMALSSAQAADPVTIQLKWVSQAQFAGYFVAKDKGFYKDAGLEVTIKPGGPDVAPPQVIAGGGADVVVDWMPAALAAREKGAPMVNIAQPFKHSGLELTCRADGEDRRGAYDCEQRLLHRFTSTPASAPPERLGGALSRTAQFSRER